MNGRRRLLAGAALAGACAATAGPRPELDHAQVSALAPADFPGAERILSGFDPPDGGGGWRVGDAALFGLAVRRGDEVERRLLQLRVASLTGHRALLGEGRRMDVRLQQRATLTLQSPGHAPTQRQIDVTPIAIELTQFDPSGRPRRSSSIELYEELLETGLRPLDDVRDDDRSARALLLLFTLQRLGIEDPTLQDQLFAIVDGPGLLSVLFHLGVHVSIASGGLTPWRGTATAGGAAHPAALQLDVSINGAPALYSDLLIADSQQPFAVAGGVIGAVARHASDPSRSAVLRLLAARRGPP